jgi:hypothetical protein
VSRADLSLTLLGSLAQVTRPSDNSLVANANVSVYSVSYYDKQVRAGRLVQDRRQRPGRFGVAGVGAGRVSSSSPCRRATSCIVLRNRAAEQLLQADYYASLRASGHHRPQSLQGGRCRVGEGLFAPVRLDGDRLAARASSRVYGTIQWVRDDPKSVEVVEAAVSEFGAYVATFHVPATVSYGVNTAQFWTAKPTLQTRTATSTGSTAATRQAACQSMSPTRAFRPACSR